MEKSLQRPREGYAIARDGAPIYYSVTGADGPAIVLSDGIGCEGYIWKYLKRDLGDQYRLVHWNYRGHGRTPVPKDRSRVSMGDLADDLAAVMDAAGVESATLAGHSMGVQVCLESFRRHQRRVAGLVLMCGSYGHPLRTFKGRCTLETALPYAAFAINRSIIGGLIGSVWRNVIPTKLAFTLATRMEINPELVRFEDFFPYLEHIASVDLPLFVDMLAHAGRHSAREILPTIDVPTLIIAGEHDGFTPMALSEEMHEQIRGSDLLVIESGSHTAPIERPQLVTERVQAFLGRVIQGRLKAPSFG
jgi:pimeloyl-ACP methyl ester carboxylesterase